MRQHAPPSQGASNDSFPLDHKGLCRLCLVPIELVQLPTVQLQPDVGCLVSLTVKLSMHLSVFPSRVCNVRPAHALGSDQMLAKWNMSVEHAFAFCTFSDVLLQQLLHTQAPAAALWTNRIGKPLADM